MFYTSQPAIKKKKKPTSVLLKLPKETMIFLLSVQESDSAKQLSYEEVIKAPQPKKCRKSMSVNYSQYYFSRLHDKPFKN